jgi:hypothetical protein
MNLRFWEKVGSKKHDTDQHNIESNTVIDDPDGSVIVEGGFSAYGIAYNGWTPEIPKDEIDLIRKYRDLTLIPEVDYAVDDISNEAISTDGTETSVNLILDDTELSENIKKKIVEEFENILRIMRFKKNGYSFFRDFYVDGRIGFHKIVDSKNPRKGIIGIRQFDSLALKKFRMVERDADGIVVKFRDAYVYDESALVASSKKLQYRGKKFELPKESVAFVHYGEFDPMTNAMIGPLHWSIKWANNLSMMEDATVVYRYSRASEKRVFYIDTGNLPPAKAEAFVAKIMGRYKNKIVYDPVNGSVKDQKNLLSMYEDFWLPRSASGKGTEVTTLQSGQNLGEMDDVLYFRKKLYQSLKIPISRIENDGMIQFGKLAEITRDELKFSKHVNRLRNLFSEIFTDILGTQVTLKKILTEDEWLNIIEDIRYDFIQDSHIAQQKDYELIQAKSEITRDLDPYIGVYFSHEWVQKTIWRQTDEEIAEEKKKIKLEGAEPKDDDRDSEPDDEGTDKEDTDKEDSFIPNNQEKD